MVGRRQLPKDLLVEVLLWLPVESLVRFKCVSKHWYALITSPSFVEMHFRHKRNHVHLFICNLTLTRESHSIDFSLLPTNIVQGVVPEQKTVHQLQCTSDFWSIIGPVDGLFLVENASFFDEGNAHLALWNPATREVWPLPPASFESQPFRDHDDQFALGFDPLTQDYKVLYVRTFWDEEGLGISPDFFVSVYSLHNNSWKDLRPDFPDCCNLHKSIGATHLNGVYYWICGLRDNIFRMCTFDMGSEQFGEMQGPYIPYTQWGKLMLRGDSLAILVGGFGRQMTSVYDVWEMNLEGSWTKVLSVQPQIGAHKPRNVWEEDKMIFQIAETSQLVVYDPTTRQVIDLGFQLDLIIGRSWVFNYKQSLVQLKRKNDSQG
ncbi:F-box only protein 8-like isoform X1 [Solanum lycopersicum]|uniref:F-box only protein 8-like isoform X1 n=1 Tax=Solanum lycopersicum TaxID=4081 RepID=UPI0002BC9E38|nr:F-box only protein 8 isoform X1 [Solanum lycopersicum]